MSAQTVKYTVTVHDGEDDGMLWAEVNELPGCFASGETLDQLREALEEAISLYVTDDPDRGTIERMVKRDDEPEAGRMHVDEMHVRVPA